jgi:type II secretory pathway pseudopilin PulG
MRRDAFTLMELLVVIGIIMLLMALLFPALGMVRRHSLKVKCQTLMAQVEAACDHYRNLNGDYPDSLGMSSAFMSGTTPRLSTDPAIGWTAVAGDLLTRIRSVDPDHFTGTALEDPWRQSLRYRPVQYYPFSAAAAKNVDKDPPPNSTKFQLWSCGPDEKDDQGESSSDDLTNWKK